MRPMASKAIFMAAGLTKGATAKQSALIAEARIAGNTALVSMLGKSSEVNNA